MTRLESVDVNGNSLDSLKEGSQYDDVAIMLYVYQCSSSFILKNGGILDTKQKRHKEQASRGWRQGEAKESKNRDAQNIENIVL